jgi:endogenous inhibitor of DNA gyrase (YacG/DUF329 family)
MSKKFEVYCPNCKKKFEYYFDLGQWLTESYTVPVEKLTEDEQETLEHLLHEKDASQENDDDQNHD